MNPRKITLADARQVAAAACSRAGVTLVSPDSLSVVRAAFRAGIAATTPLTIHEVASRVSFYVPRLAGDIVALLPANITQAFPAVVRNPAIYVSPTAWEDATALVGVVAHELGHAAQDVAASRLGTVGGVAHGIAYLACDLLRSDCEATCYTADLTARVLLDGAEAAPWIEATLAGLRSTYRLDEHALDHARAVLLSAAGSLSCHVLHGRGTPIEAMLRDLRVLGVDVGPVVLP